MPYIEQFRRNDITTPETSGELNFMITELLLKYMRHNGKCYSTFNGIIGACEGAKLEFYRRVIENYENSKIELNGDVYTEEDLILWKKNYRMII